MLKRFARVLCVPAVEAREFILITGFLMFFIAGCLGHACAATYYVDNCVVTGSDSNNGTSPSTPWLTNTKVNASTFNPGDSVLFRRGCTWRQQLVPASSGSSGNPITFGAYGSGAQPILNGTQVMAGAWSPYSGSIYYASFASPPSLVFQDGPGSLALATSITQMAAGSFYYETNTSRLYVWATDGTDPSNHTIEASVNPPIFYGLVEINNKSYITIDNLHITKSNYYGILINGTSGHITIQNSTFDYGLQCDISTGGTSATYDSVDVIGNTFSNGGIGRTRPSGSGAGNGAEAEPINGFGIQNSVIRGNDIINTTPGPDALHQAEGITIDANAANVEISYNEVSNTSVGIYVSSGYGNGGNTESITVKYNYVYKSTLNNYQIALEGSKASISGVDFYGNVGDSCGGDNLLFGYNDTGGVIENTRVYNNTFYGCPEGMVAYGPTSDASNLFENNIVYANSVAFLLGDANEANYSPDYNLLFVSDGANNTIEWRGTYYSLQNFKSTKNKMLNSKSADPILVSPPDHDFSLQSSSPAIDAGANLGSTYEFGLASWSSWPSSITTLDQNSYGPGWEVGAYVYGGQANNTPSPPNSFVAIPR